MSAAVGVWIGDTTDGHPIGLQAVAASAVAFAALWILFFSRALVHALFVAPRIQRNEARALVRSLESSLREQSTRATADIEAARQAKARYDQVEPRLQELESKLDIARNHALRRGLEIERRHAEAEIARYLSNLRPENGFEWTPGMPNLTLDPIRYLLDNWSGRVTNLFHEAELHDLETSFRGDPIPLRSKDEPRLLTERFERQMNFIATYLDGQQFP